MDDGVGLDTVNRTTTRLPFVERMLKLHKDLPKARTAPDKTVRKPEGPTASG